MQNSILSKTNLDSTQQAFCLDSTQLVSHMEFIAELFKAEGPAR